MTVDRKNFKIIEYDLKDSILLILCDEKNSASASHRKNEARQN